MDSGWRVYGGEAVGEMKGGQSGQLGVNVVDERRCPAATRTDPATASDNFVARLA